MPTKDEVVTFHNWLYSVVPNFPDPSSNLTNTSGIFLVGYCKNCNKTFTKRLSLNYNYIVEIEDAYVPKVGCAVP